jgi:hypothetical protein
VKRKICVRENERDRLKKKKKEEMKKREKGMAKKI